MTDYNKFSFADKDGVEKTGVLFQLTDNESCDDLLKCSKLTNSRFTDCKILGNENVRENAIDCNRYCASVTFLGCKIQGGNQAVVVVKGGCSNIRFLDCTVTPSRKSWCDVLVDDWSDQSKNPSTNLDLTGLVRTDGKKLRIVFGRWVKPAYDKETARICWIKTIGLHAYNIVKGLLR